MLFVSLEQHFIKDTFYCNLMSFVSLDQPPILQEQNITNNTEISDGTFRINICVHEDTVYLTNKDLWFFNCGDFIWKKISPLPICSFDGQSITSTPYGIVFFGGNGGNSYFSNDLWIFDKGNWDYITCEIPVRADHASAWDKRGFLVITGGKNDSDNLNDIFLVDLVSHEVKELKIDGFPKFRNHSLTPLDEGKFALFGGFIINDDGNEIINTKLFILNLLDLKITEIETDMKIEGFGYHFASLIYNMLFVVNYETNKTMIFNFDKNIWIPLTIENYKKKIIFLFSSYNFSQNKAIHIIDNEFETVSSYQIFSKPPPEKIKNHPQFINFLYKNLRNVVKSMDVFNSPLNDEKHNLKKNINGNKTILIDKLNQTKLVDENLVNSIFDLTDEYEKVKKILARANSINRLMETCSKPKSFKEPSFIEYLPETEICIDQTVIDLHNMKHVIKKELNPILEDASKLSDQIEKLTFSYQVDNKIENKIMESITKFERTLENSRQLAKQIEFEKVNLFEEKERYDDISMQIKETHLDVLDQLWSITNLSNQINSEIIQVKHEFYEKLSNLLLLRKKELEYTDEEGRSKLLMFFTIPEKEESIKNSQKKLYDFIDHLNLCVNDLNSTKSNQRESSPYQKLLRLARSIKNIQKWAEIKKKANQTHKPIKVMSSKKSSATKKHKKKNWDTNIKSIESFSDYLGNSSMFLDDINININILLEKIEDTLN